MAMSLVDININLLWFCTIEETEDIPFMILSDSTSHNDFAVYRIPPESLFPHTGSSPPNLELILNLRPAELPEDRYPLDTTWSQFGRQMLLDSNFQGSRAQAYFYYSQLMTTTSAKLPPQERSIWIWMAK